MDATRMVIQGLMDDFRRQELQRQISAAVTTWSAAFISFKRFRNKVGFPKKGDQQQALFYGAILASIKGSGKFLLGWIDKEQFDPASAGISKENLTACVQEMIEDDMMLESGLLDQEFPDLEARFCKA